jgi:hypothetical protein
MTFVTAKSWYDGREARHQLARDETNRAVDYIRMRLQQLETIGAELEKSLEANGTFTAAELEAMLMERAKAHPHIFGIGVAYRPYAFDPNRRLYAPYVKYDNGRRVLTLVEDTYDYTQPEHEWYGATLKQGKMWHEPYYGEVSRSMLAVYTFPFYRGAGGERSVAGVGYVDYTLNEMREFLASLELGKSGYGVILSKEGYVVSHPDVQMVTRRTNLAAVAEKSGDTELKRLVQAVATKQSGELSIVEKATGRKAWVVHRLIPEAGWTFLSIIFEEPTPEAARTFQRQMIVISLLLLGGMLCLLALLRRRFGWSDWMLVTMASLLILSEIVLIWNIAVDEHPAGAKQTVISDTAMLEKWKEARRADAQRHHRAPPRFIPTGIFVENMIHRTGHDIALNGYLWQQYTKGRDDDLHRGVQFVEITETISEEFMPLYRYEYGDQEVVGWQFRIIVREEYWPLRYPLDSRQIHVRLRHPDFLAGVQLVPELSSYALLMPEALPGVDARIHIPGWKAVSSHFELVTHDYHTSFGAEETHGMPRLDDLCFVFTIEREFLGPFIAHLIPMVVVSIMLFALLVLVRRSDKEHLVGFSAMEVLATVGGLFFVLIIAHSDFRDTSEVPRIIYLENFYFLLYIAIVAVAVDALLFITRRDLGFVQYHENLLPKLLYWPVLLGAVLAVTVYYFY